MPARSLRRKSALAEPLEARRLLSTIYVDAAASGGNSGADWADACTSLQSALAVAVAGTTIEVGQGIYFPTNGTSRTATFQLLDDVTLEGGFAGIGADPNARNNSVYPTILSGDIGVSGNISENSYHVVTGTGVNSSAVLDGFTIEDGNADAANGDYAGGGVYMYGLGSTPTISDCAIIDNTGWDGGGLAAYHGAAPIVINCEIDDNTSTGADNTVGGGGIALLNASATLTGCTINDNSTAHTALFGWGGGIFYSASFPTLTLSLTDCTIEGDGANEGGGIYATYGTLRINNCVFEGDTSTSGGGAIRNAIRAGEGSVSIVNTTITGNAAPSGEGGAIYEDDDGQATIANSVLWGDTGGELASGSASSMTITCSDVSGGVNGDGNVDANPDFLNSPGNLQLAAGSPCINAGSNADVVAGTSTDLAGQPRIIGSAVDMGAYEAQYFTWTDSAEDGDWNNPADWSTDDAPGPFSQVTIPAGFDVQIPSGSFAVASLNIEGDSQLDITTATLTIDYGTSTDPIVSIAADLATGYSGGGWNGAGIVSSAVATANAAQSRVIYSVGYVDNTVAGQIEIMPALAGDATLSGTVDFGDFQILAAHFGSAGAWDDGNFRFGNTINFGDFQSLAQNFGQSASSNGAVHVVSAYRPPALAKDDTVSSANDLQQMIDSILDG
ncbi:MAG TPA: right-handed parallel beta-helix repeat-containing protein [Tepidisphaeraceae bacterium]|nr:right-handed parallel beta-helix repeat-containing protein [Tepidisphaeraceae bacterium]